MARFEKDQYAVYGKVGVCRVVDCRTMSFGTAGEGEYYELSPLSDPGSSLYVPVDNEKLMARLRPLMTRQEISDTLTGVPEEDVVWIDEKSQRNSRFHAIVVGGDRYKLLRLIRCLYFRKQERVAAGKKLAAADEATLQEGLRLVEEEFSLSLELPRNQVAPYICACLDKELAGAE